MHTVLEGLHHIGHKTWVSQVKDIMEKAELAELWTNPGPLVFPLEVVTSIRRRIRRRNVPPKNSFQIYTSSS